MPEPPSPIAPPPSTPFVELTRLPTRLEAEGLIFTLEAAGIFTRLVPVQATGNGSGQYWSVLVDTDHFLQAQEILQEERGVPQLTLVPPAPAISPPGLYWIVGLMVVNFLVLWVMEGSGGSQSREVLLRFGASYAPAVLDGQWWRLITAIFLHMGARHFLANMVTLLVFGPFVLRTWGIGRFYFMYMTCGLAGNLFSLAFAPTSAIKAGASGAILGLLGILAGQRIRGLRGPSQPSRYKAWHVVAMIIAFYGFVVGVGPADHLAHVGGLLMGGVWGFVLPPPGRHRPRVEQLLEIGLGSLSLVLMLVSGWLAYAQP